MSKSSVAAVTATTLVVSRRMPEPGALPGAQELRWPLRRVDVVAIWAALLLACVLYLSCAAVPRLFDQIDGQYAGAAREMLARGDLLIPTQDGVPRLQKPPLIYWLEMASFRALGTNEFAARLPLVLSTMGWFAVTGLFAWRITGRAVLGALAALVLATFSGTFLFTHLVMPEPFLALTMSLTIWALWSAQQQRASARQRTAWLTAAWFFIACGSLAKGLHALIFPVLTYGLMAWVAPGLRLHCKRFVAFWPGWTLFLAMLLPWYAAVELRYPGFLKDQLWNEQVGHVFNRRWPTDTARVPLALFWAEHLGLLFPWTVFLPLIVPRLIAGCRRWRDQLGRPLSFLWAWFIVNALTISFSSIQDYYLLVSWPTLAVGIATVFTGWERQTRRLAAAAGGATLIALGGAALTARELLQHNLADHPAASGSGIDMHLLAALQALPTSGSNVFVQLLGVMAAVLVGGGLAVVLSAHWNRPAFAAVSTGLISLTFFTCGAAAMLRMEHLFSSWPIAAYLGHAKVEGYDVASESESNDYTSLFFYLPHRVYWVNGHPDTEFATRVHGIGRNLYLTEDQLLEVWKRNRPLFLITQKQRLLWWKEHVVNSGGKVHVALDCGSRVVLTNRPEMQTPEPAAARSPD